MKKILAVVLATSFAASAFTVPAVAAPPPPPPPAAKPWCGPFAPMILLAPWTWGNPPCTPLPTAASAPPPPPPPPPPFWPFFLPPPPPAH